MHLNFLCYCIFQSDRSVKVSFCHIYSFDAAGSLNCWVACVSWFVDGGRTRTFAVWLNQHTELRWLSSAGICLHMRSSLVAYTSTRHFCFTDICRFCSTPNCNITSGLKCLVYKIECLQKYRDVLAKTLEYKKHVV